MIDHTSPVDDTRLNLLLKYPMISAFPVQEEIIQYRGLMEINGEDYQISVKELPDKTMVLESPASLLSADELLLFESNFIFRINASDRKPEKYIVAYLDYLRLFVESKVPVEKPANYCDIYRQVLYEYSELTKFYLNIKSCYLSADLRKINVSTLDDKLREHSLEVTVKYKGNKDIFQMTGYDLPQESDRFRTFSSLRAVYDHFLGLVESFQPFFDLMEVFDKNCWVLDPVPPNRKYNYRRIGLDKHSSMIITVDPFNVSHIPDIKFLAPERVIDSYRYKMNENLGNWDSKNDPFVEILQLLGMDKFPEKRPVDEFRGDMLLMESGDCSICFSLRLNEKLPEIVCKNSNCENYYHVECLYEWLMSVNAKRYFTEVLGKCPNCEKSISCPIPK